MVTTYASYGLMISNGSKNEEDISLFGYIRTIEIKEKNDYCLPYLLIIEILKRESTYIYFSKYI